MNDKHRVVYKYPLSLTAMAQVVAMPAGARIVHVHEQSIGGAPHVCLWAEVDEPAPMVERTLCVFATGEPIAVAFRRYIGTVHIDWTVWHVYENDGTDDFDSIEEDRREFERRMP